MTENNLLSLIIFAPLIGAAINGFFGKLINNERVTGFIASAAVAVSCVIAFMIAFGIGTPHKGALTDVNPIFDHLWTWIQVGNFRADFGLAMDRLSGIYVCFITFVGFLIHIFATGYMKGDSGFYRFFAYLNLFMFAMLTLILADNFLLMFVGWEGVGLCSYLLIGYFIQKDEARKAAKKAFVANRIGDWGVIMGVFLVFTLSGSISFYHKAMPDGTVVNSALTTIAQMAKDPSTFGALFAGGITSAAILLFIGATGKSAQIPLFVWLPDAMAGPTPVSALIHAATMVTAGVYMVVRCNGIFQNAPMAMMIVAIIGCATAVFAATIGLAQNDIKKVLAYSTVSQLGYMFLACGVGAFTAAIFHVMTHAFFKALLFLGSGSVIHGMHHEQDMRRMGNLKKYMPITWITMLTGWLAICGIPIFAGFFSKDEILYKTFSATNLGSLNYALWIIGLFTAGLTATYMTRLMYMTFWGTERFDLKLEDAHHDDDDDHHHDDHHDAHDFKPHESPWSMTVPLIVLAVLSVFGGLVGIPAALTGGKDINIFEHTLEPVIAKVGKPLPSTMHISSTEVIVNGKAIPAEEHKASAAGHDAHHTTTELILAAISVIVALLGMAIGWTVFKKDPLKKMPKVLENKWYVDEIYNGAVIDPLTNFSRGALWKGFDVGIIDGVVNGLGRSVAAVGTFTRGIQVGFIRSYAAIILLGAVFVLGWFIYYGLKLIG